MNYGHHVRDLLLELKRSEDTGGNSMEVALPAYNDISVRNALQDFHLHVQALQEQVEAAALANGESGTVGKPSLSVRPSILLQNAACQRNKRGLLAYHWIRLQRIQELFYWQGNQHHDASIFNQSIRMNEDHDSSLASISMKQLCPSEVEFLLRYRSILSKYTDNIGIPEISDLRAHCTLPPITVDRVLCRVADTTPFGGADGSIVLESGQCVNFTFGSTHYLIYSDCEEYIRSGALQILETEET
jgi:hypothetical protein